MDPTFQSLNPVSRAILALETTNPSDGRIEQLRQTLDSALAGQILSETVVDSAALGARIERYTGKKRVIEQLNTEIAKPSKRVKLVDLESPVEELFLLAEEETDPETKIRRYQELIRHPEIGGERKADAMYNLSHLLHGEDELSLYRGIVSEREARSETKAAAMFQLAWRSKIPAESDSLVDDLLREPDASDWTKVQARTMLAQIHYGTDPNRANTEILSIIYDSEVSQEHKTKVMLHWGIHLKTRDSAQAICFLTIVKDDRKALPGLRTSAKFHLASLLPAKREELLREIKNDEDLSTSQRAKAARAIKGTNVVNEPNALTARIMAHMDPKSIANDVSRRIERDLDVPSAKRVKLEKVDVPKGDPNDQFIEILKDPKQIQGDLKKLNREELIARLEDSLEGGLTLENLKTRLALIRLYPNSSRSLELCEHILDEANGEIYSQYDIFPAIMNMAKNILAKQIMKTEPLRAIELCQQVIGHPGAMYITKSNAKCYLAELMEPNHVEEAQRLYSEVMNDLNPEVPPTISQYAIYRLALLVAKTDEEEAKKLLSFLLSQKGISPGLWSDAKYNFAFLTKKTDEDEAKKLFSELKDDPKTVPHVRGQAKFQLAWLIIKTDEDEAKKLFSELKDDPKTVPRVRGQAKFQLALLTAKTDEEEAKRLYAEVIAEGGLEELILEAKYKFALLVAKTDEEEAKKLFSELKDDPKAVPRVRGQAKFQLALLTIKTDQEEAKRLYSEVIAENENSPDLWSDAKYNFALLTKKTDEEEAKKLFSELKDDPKTVPRVRGQAKFQLALLTAKTDEEEAKRLYREVMNDQGAWPEIRAKAKFQLALLTAKTDEEEAKRLYREVMNEQGALPEIRAQAKFRFALLTERTDVEAAKNRYREIVDGWDFFGAEAPERIKAFARDRLRALGPSV